ncbi:salivary peroxidase/catechol oxidase-like [Oratosquilla oratoria]|uniref:salivary peroxidase/catechol oxidase-like n=1 Tax=Oratosquilla oratoria TaxID=337810 RepID=UPI003F75BF46
MTEPSPRYTPYSPETSESCSSSSVPCVPLVTCAPHYDQLKALPYATCRLHGGALGVCCPPEEKSSGDRTPMLQEQPVAVKILPISKEELNAAARTCFLEFVQRDLLEKSLQEQNIVVSDSRSAAYGHLQFFRTSPEAMKLGKDGLLRANICNQLVQKLNLTPLQAGFGLRSFTTKDTIIEDTCPRRPKCTEKRYRNSDGSCNNLQNSMWGKALTPFQRAVAPHYSDGYFAPRNSSRGGSLPTARAVSVSTVRDVDQPFPDITLFVMQFGQFIDHDLTHSPIFRFGDESGIKCCDDRGRVLDPPFRHPACFPILIAENDPFFARFGRRCMNFVRSMPAPRSGCGLGNVEQMNQVTHFLDGSAVYGSSERESEELREKSRGLLKMQKTNGLLPEDPDLEKDFCGVNRCFKAGDGRVNEMTGLAAIQTIWVREHNRLVTEMARLNPHWTGETLFQETRRILVAEMQHITYNEWLPIIVGTQYAQSRRLLPLRRGFSQDYDASVNPSILNEFATVAFRFGHTLVQGMIKLFDKSGRTSEVLRLRESFHRPTHLYTPGKLDEYLRGLVTQKAQRFDNSITRELTNHLFDMENQGFGMDLVALNIQRGRDHGVVPYNELRAACGLPRATDFKDLHDVIPPQVVSIFASLYRHVDDIDPFIAGISETPVEGAILGPTFRCIIGDQFTRLKRGDRFFYDNADLPTSFTEVQLHEIRKASWARILCDNGDNIEHMQPLAMRSPVGINEKVSCASPAIPRLDLTPWISSPY